MEYMIHISTLKCDHCEQSIKDTLAHVEGLKEYRVDLTNKSVFVSTGTATIESISRALREAGYPPENITP